MWILRLWDMSGLSKWLIHLPMIRKCFDIIIIVKSKIKATNIWETPTMTEGTRFLSNDENEAGSLGRFEYCVVIGSVQSGTETVSLKQI